VVVPREPEGLPPLPEFEPAPSRTRIEIRRFQEAMRQLTTNVAGRSFARLSQDADYSARYEAGYEQGRKDGFDVAYRLWYDDYAEVVKAMVNGLMALASDVRPRRALFVATIEELFVRPFTGGPPVWQQPRYNELLAALRPTQKRAPVPEPAPAEDGDADEQAAEMLEAAAYADAMQRVPQKAAATNLLDLIDIQAAEWLAELDARVTSLLADTLALNCKPYEQGYLVGSWTSQAAVNTLRYIIEWVLRDFGSDPINFLVPAKVDIAVNAALAGIAMELEDDD
jgi:hypothetical protein